MKQKQRIIFFGMVAVALIFAACDGDSGNNSSEMEGDSSSSIEFSSSSEQINTSSVVKSSSSSVGLSSSSLVVSSSSVKVPSSSSTALSSSVVKSSSSSVGLSSSSVTLPSSSSVEVCTNIYGINTVKDCRDNQTYKTVTIGTQTWMAENLNYADSVAMTNLRGNSWCYNNRVDSCAKYGRLYTWTGAMNIASYYQERSANAVVSTLQQGVCPSDWHIPTKAEWTILENAVGGEDVAGTVLKSTSGWYDSGNGTDNYGFSALPAGYRDYYYDDCFGVTGYTANFWSATGYYAYNAYYWYLNHVVAIMNSAIYDKSYAYSVRCVKDL